MRETPSKTWEFRLRRFDKGAESVNLSQRPHHYKHCLTVAQIDASGTYRMMQAMPRGTTQMKWGPEEYRVETVDGTIRAHCRTGDATIPEMTGSLLWECVVRGRSVFFNGELVAQRAVA